MDWIWIGFQATIGYMLVGVAFVALVILAFLALYAGACIWDKYNDWKRSGKVAPNVEDK